MTDPGDESETSERTMFRKAVEDQIVEDEFNINSTVGLVSALMLSVLATSLSDSYDLKNYGDPCEQGWYHEGSDCYPKFEMYQLFISFSLT